MAFARQGQPTRSGWCGPSEYSRELLSQIPDVQQIITMKLLKSSVRCRCCDNDSCRGERTFTTCQCSYCAANRDKCVCAHDTPNGRVDFAWTNRTPLATVVPYVVPANFPIFSLNHDRVWAGLRFRNNPYVLLKVSLSVAQDRYRREHNVTDHLLDYPGNIPRHLHAPFCDCVACEGSLGIVRSQHCPCHICELQHAAGTRTALINQQSLSGSSSVFGRPTTHYPGQWVSSSNLFAPGSAQHTQQGWFTGPSGHGLFGQGGGQNLSVHTLSDSRSPTAGNTASFPVTSIPVLSGQGLVTASRGSQVLGSPIEQNNAQIQTICLQQPQRTNFTQNDHGFPRSGNQISGPSADTNEIWETDVVPLSAWDSPFGMSSHSGSTLGSKPTPAQPMRFSFSGGTMTASESVLEERQEEAYWPNIEKYLNTRSGPRPIVKCVICMEEISIQGLPHPEAHSDGEEPEEMTLLPCKHVLGKRCFSRHCQENGNRTRCPICNFEIGNILFDNELQQRPGDGDNRRDLNFTPGQATRRGSQVDWRSVRRGAISG